MMMPSVVRNERILLRTSARAAHAEDLERGSCGGSAAEDVERTLRRLALVGDDRGRP